MQNSLENTLYTSNIKAEAEELLAAVQAEIAEMNKTAIDRVAEVVVSSIFSKATAVALPIVALLITVL
jgi:hypothetical protein